MTWRPNVLFHQEVTEPLSPGASNPSVPQSWESILPTVPVRRAVLPAAIIAGSLFLPTTTPATPKPQVPTAGWYQPLETPTRQLRPLQPAAYTFVPVVAQAPVPKPDAWTPVIPDRLPQPRQLRYEALTFVPLTTLAPPSVSQGGWDQQYHRPTRQLRPLQFEAFAFQGPPLVPPLSWDVVLPRPLARARPQLGETSPFVPLVTPAPTVPPLSWDILQPGPFPRPRPQLQAAESSSTQSLPPNGVPALPTWDVQPGQPYLRPRPQLVEAGAFVPYISPPVPPLSWDIKQPGPFRVRYPVQPEAQPFTPRFTGAAPAVPHLSWLAGYPDWLRGPKQPIHTQETKPVLPPPVPALSWRGVYPDRLWRPVLKQVAPWFSHEVSFPATVPLQQIAGFILDTDGGYLFIEDAYGHSFTQDNDGGYTFELSGGATMPWAWKRGDTLTPITGTIRKPGGAVMNLTGYSVKLRMRRYAGGPVKFERSATITDAVNGAVSYQPQSDGSDTSEAGTYLGEWIATDGAGRLVQIPTQNHLAITIYDNLTT